MRLRSLSSVFVLGLSAFSFATITTSANRCDAREVWSIDDYLGEWEMVIVNSSSTFGSCWLELKRGEADAIIGAIVWRFGSVLPLKGDQIKLSDGGELSIHPSGWKHPLKVTRYGEHLEGSQEQGKSNFIVYALRNKSSANPVGSWKIEVERDGEFQYAGQLTISSDGFGRLRAKGESPEGKKSDWREVSIRGEKLRMSFETDDGTTVRLSGIVKGDQFEGRLEAGDYSAAARGKRERKWGKDFALLDEQGIARWKSRKPQEKFGWVVEGGVLVNATPGVDIISRQTFGDLRLSLEYKFDHKGSNSGIYLRGRYEVQLLQDNGQGARKHGNGAVYSRLSPSVNASKAPGEWQRMEITLIGRYVTVVVNGQKVLDNQRLEGITGGALDPFQASAGPLMLQGDHGKVQFRNIVVTPALD